MITDKLKQLQQELSEGLSDEESFTVRPNKIEIGFKFTPNQKDWYGQYIEVDFADLINDMDKYIHIARLMAQDVKLKLRRPLGDDQPIEKSPLHYFDKRRY